MALDTRRHRRHDTPDANISNKTLPGFAVMGVGLLLVIVGAILIAALGSPPADLATEPEKVAGVSVIAVGLVVGISGAGLALYLKNKYRRSVEGKRPGEVTISETRRPSSTVCNIGPVSYSGYYNQDPVYGPPAPMASPRVPRPQAPLH
jgi:hypothetical protein